MSCNCIHENKCCCHPGHARVKSIGIGTALAVLISWIKWHSIGWAIVHGLFGWLYIIYYFIKYGVDSI